MYCEFDITLISGHLDGENTPSEESRLQQHLATCSECRQLLRVMRENDEKLKSSVVQPPIDLTSRIMKQVRKQPKKRFKRYMPLITGGVAAAAILAVALIGNITPPAKPEVPPTSTAVKQEVYSYAQTPTIESVVEVESMEMVPKATEEICMTEGQAYGTSALEDPKAPVEDSADKKVASALAVLTIHAKQSDISVEGKKISFDQLRTQLKSTDYKLTGEETGAIMVSWQTLQQIVLGYEDQFEMEKYYSEDANYIQAIIFFME